MIALIEVGLWAILIIGMAAMLAFVLWSIVRGFQLQVMEIQFRRHLQNEDYQSALLTIQQSLRINPLNGLLYCHRAKVYSAMGDYNAAESDYTQGLRYGQGGSASSSYAGRAAARLELGRYKEALIDANHVIACNRLWWRGFYERGRVYASLGHDMVALDDFNQALSLNRFPPPELYLARAETALKLGDDEAAGRDRQKAAQLARH